MSTLATREPMAVSSETVAAPMPLAPPVTRATRSLRSTTPNPRRARLGRHLVLPTVGQHPEAVACAGLLQGTVVVGHVAVPDGDGHAVREVDGGREPLGVA